MSKRLLILTMLGIALLTGCAGEKGKEQMETAQFEEKQGNREHAVKLYNEVVQKFPGSDNASKAAARLSELNKGK